MSLEVTFLSGADSDLQTIFSTLEEYREGLGAEFIVSVDA